ncbi:hypothetical protein B484DRAFT_265564 [Ochromonadaceae sp. CCMP2298]|nr:hypothetical protein B484DRAFT_265564 [Ochromonadaceae sp. CCMP2298]
MNTRGLKSRRGAPALATTRSTFERGQAAAIAADPSLAGRIQADPARYAEDLEMQQEPRPPPRHRARRATHQRAEDPWEDACLAACWEEQHRQEAQEAAPAFPPAFPPNNPPDDPTIDPFPLLTQETIELPPQSPDRFDDRDFFGVEDLFAATQEQPMEVDDDLPPLTQAMELTHPEDSVQWSKLDVLAPLAPQVVPAASEDQTIESIAIHHAVAQDFDVLDSEEAAEEQLLTRLHIPTMEAQLTQPWGRDDPNLLMFMHDFASAERYTKHYLCYLLWGQERGMTEQSMVGTAIKYCAYL